MLLGGAFPVELTFVGLGQHGLGDGLGVIDAAASLLGGQRLGPGGDPFGIGGRCGVLHAELGARGVGFPNPSSPVGAPPAAARRIGW